MICIPSLTHIPIKGSLFCYGSLFFYKFFLLASRFPNRFIQFSAIYTSNHLIPLLYWMKSMGLAKNPKAFDALDLNFSLFGSSFEVGESSGGRDGPHNVPRQVEQPTQDNEKKKKKKEEEMEDDKGSDLDLDLCLSQPGLVCKDKSSSSTSQNSCISADHSLVFEPSTLIVMGCIKCHLYVMVSRQHARCPKCNSCLLLDIFQPFSASS